MGSFTPFALSTLGRRGPESQVLFQDLTRYLKRDGQDLATGDPVWGRAQQLQLALKREVARMLLRGADLAEPGLPPATEPSHTAGLEEYVAPMRRSARTQARRLGAEPRRARPKGALRKFLEHHGTPNNVRGHRPPAARARSAGWRIPEPS